MSAIDRIESALKERYNVTELPERLAAAVEEAKDGSLSALESVLDGREMYRWANDVQQALKEARKALEAVVEAPFDLAKLTVAELRSLAADRGVDVPVGPKAAIVDALNAPTEPEEVKPLEESVDTGSPPADSEAAPEGI